MTDQAKPAQSLLQYASAGVKLTHQVLAQLGLPTPAGPSVEATQLLLPQNLGTIENGEIATYLATYANLMAFAQYQVAIAASNYDATNEAVKLHTRKALLAWPKDDKKTSITEREALALMDPKVTPLVVQRTHLATLKRVLEAVLAGYEAKYNAVSRELSRREKGLGVHGRGDSYGG